MTSLRGIPASPGVAIGEAILYIAKDLAIPRREIASKEIPTEGRRFEEALIQTRHQIINIQKGLAEDLGHEQAAIFNAHLLVLEDQSLREEIISGLKNKQLNVESIFDDAIQRHLKAFSRTEDEYLRERTADIEDVRKRVLRNLLGQPLQSLAHLDHPVAVELHALEIG